MSMSAAESTTMTPTEISMLLLGPRLKFTLGPNFASRKSDAHLGHRDFNNLDFL
jgi:hypothetical protein